MILALHRPWPSQSFLRTQAFAHAYQLRAMAMSGAKASCRGVEARSDHMSRQARKRANVRIGSPVNVAAGAVRAAIDVLAGVLTSNPEYFWGGSSSAADQKLAESTRRDCIERGEEPWPP
jgi:hypothetical protein